MRNPPRAAAAWAKEILAAEQRFGDGTDVVFQSHNRPHWDAGSIKANPENTAAVFKHIIGP